MRSRLLAVVLAAVVVAATVVASPGTAQEATGSVTLASQTSFRIPGQPFTAALRVRTSAATTGLEVAVGTYRRLGSRSEFSNVLEGRLPTRTPTDLARFPLDSLALDADGNAIVTIEPRVSREGVYPVRVELRETAGGDVIDGFTTFLISVPATVEADPLDVALVLPVHAPPAVAPDGQTALDAQRADAIAGMAAVLARNPSVPLTVWPTPETLEALSTSERAADRDTASALATAVGTRQVAPNTYVPTDLAALVGEGLTGEVGAQLERGGAVIGDVLGASVAGDLRVVEERLDDAALAVLENQGVDRLLTRESQLEPIRLPNSLTLTATFSIKGRNGSFAAAAADPALSAHFDRNVPPALAASQLLADLAVLWLDLPGRSSARRGVVALPARGWLPNDAFLDAVLTGIGTNPIFAPVTLDGFLEAVAPARSRNETLTRTFLPVEATGVSGSAIRTARRQLEGFASIVAPDNPELALLDRALLVSQSSDLRAPARAARLREITGRIERQLAQIDMPERRSITLTAREGELPVTITNRLPYPITVVVVLESDALDFPGGATRRLELTRQNTTERFEIHARGSGSFPVRIRVIAPQGDLVIEESGFTVRSTAVSGVGIALSVGAALFLVVWWASHLRSRRRPAAPIAPASA